MIIWTKTYVQIIFIGYLMTHLILKETVANILLDLSRCFVNVIKENKQTFVYAVEFNEESTWTIYSGPNNWSFNPNINDLNIDTSLSSVGYFRFTFRYSIFCIVFILQMDTFQSTISAIEKSGLSTSEYALTLVYTPSEDGVVNMGFNNGKLLHQVKSMPFSVDIAFFQVKPAKRNLQIVGIYCYYCDNGVCKIVKADTHHMISTNLHTVASFKNLLDRMKAQNNGLESTFFDWYSPDPELAGLWRSNICKDSKNYNLMQNTIVNCNRYEVLLLRMALESSNTSVFQVQSYDSYKGSTKNWRVLTHFIMYMRGSPYNTKNPTKNLHYMLRWKGITISSIPLKYIYCKQITATNDSAWNTYTGVYGIEVWVALVIIILSYGVSLQKPLCSIIELLNPLIKQGMCIDRKHLILLGAYLAFSSFISEWYNSGLSANCLFMNDSMSFQEYFRQSYKIYIKYQAVVEQVIKVMNAPTQNYIVQTTGVGNLREAFYPKVINFSGSFTENLKTTAMRKLLLETGVTGESRWLPLTAIVNMAEKAIIDSKYVCGYVPFLLPQSVGFRIWGVGSKILAKKLQGLVDVGLAEHFTDMYHFIIALKAKVNWSKMTVSLQKPYPFSMTSPVGNVIVLLLSTNLFVIVMFLLVHFLKWVLCKVVVKNGYKARVKTWQIRSRKSCGSHGSKTVKIQVASRLASI